MQIKDHIRQIPDFPRPGILFYDISTLLAHGPAWKATVNHLDRWLEPLNADLLVGIESRGFLVSAPLAYLSGRIPRKLYANASSPVEGLVGR